MTNYKVVEIFSSINGEGTRAGQLAVFVRMQGCNLTVHTVIQNGQMRRTQNFTGLPQRRFWNCFVVWR